MKKPTFPYEFKKNGRTGKIYKTKSGKFKTYFRFAGKPCQNSFSTADAALKALDKEFQNLDKTPDNSPSLYPLRYELRVYSELEQLLAEKARGVTLREVVDFYLSRLGRLKPMSFSEAKESCLEYHKKINCSHALFDNLKRHLGRFEKEFSSRLIHEITAKEIDDWLSSQKNASGAGKGKVWTKKTRNNVRGSLLNCATYAKDTLKAIDPSLARTEFHLSTAVEVEYEQEVDIYTPEELATLLNKAVEIDIKLIPALVIGGFCGLRPSEIHAERTGQINAEGKLTKEGKRPQLTWGAFHWEDKKLHVRLQKVRSKLSREIELHPNLIAWLEPFKEAELTGDIWKQGKFHEHFANVRSKAELRKVNDGLRHSYASYRIRELKQDVKELSAEMGNSPEEIHRSYKRNVTDKEAEKWFGIFPPTGYKEAVLNHLKRPKPPCFRKV